MSKHDTRSFVNNSSRYVFSKLANVTVCIFWLVVCITADLSSLSIGTLDESISSICSIVDSLTATFFCASRNFISRALFTGALAGSFIGTFLSWISSYISSATSLSFAKISVASFLISSSASYSLRSGSSSGESSSTTSSLPREMSD